jgi:hypothetical protein
MSQSTPSDVLLCFFLVFTLLGTNACQRNETGSDAEPDSKALRTDKIGNPAGHDAPQSKIQLDLEQSKKNAVLRFPDLGVAGSEMNKAFLARVNHLKAMSSAELNNPNWPYLVAVDVNAELDQAKRRKQIAEEEKKLKDRAQKIVVPVLTASEVLEQKTLPLGDIQLVGIVTKIEPSLSNKLSGGIIIDGKIKGVFEYSLINSSRNCEVVKRGDTLLANVKDPVSGIVKIESPLYYVGQRVQLRGRFQKKGPVVAVFRFEAPPLPMISPGGEF